jgi:hypothetical protein
VTVLGLLSLKGDDASTSSIARLVESGRRSRRLWRRDRVAESGEGGATVSREKAVRSRIVNRNSKSAGGGNCLILTIESVGEECQIGVGIQRGPVGIAAGDNLPIIEIHDSYHRLLQAGCLALLFRAE